MLLSIVEWAKLKLTSYNITFGWQANGVYNLISSESYDIYNILVAAATS